MSKPASPGNCRKLFELKPEWGYPGQYWQTYGNDDDAFYDAEVQAEPIAPAYDTDYLLKRLPQGQLACSVPLNQRHGYTTEYVAYYGTEEEDYPTFTSDTPADALCLLAIKLIEEGNL